jgi:hypothetical protein
MSIILRGYVVTHLTPNTNNVEESVVTHLTSNTNNVTKEMLEHYTTPPLWLYSLHSTHDGTMTDATETGQ